MYIFGSKLSLNLLKFIISRRFLNLNRSTNELASIVALKKASKLIIATSFISTVGLFITNKQNYKANCQSNRFVGRNEVEKCKIFLKIKFLI
jgi:hypothetical protein